MSDNHIATAEDFKRAAKHLNPPERVVLPKSRLAVLLRRPTTFAVWMLDQKLAELSEPGLATLPAGDSSNKTPIPNHESPATSYAQVRQVIWSSVEAVFVQPKLSLTPGVNEVHPGWLPEEDQVFILRWVRGLIGPDGTDLVEEFFRERGRLASAVAGGEGIEHAAVANPGTVRSLRDAS